MNNQPLHGTLPDGAFYVYVPIKKKWFDMIKSGEKKEEYRDITDYWEKRFFKNQDEDTIPDDSLFTGGIYTGLDYIIFKNGYGKNAPTLIIECKGITIGSMKKEWTESNWNGDVFILKLGEIISLKYTLNT